MTSVRAGTLAAIVSLSPFVAVSATAAETCHNKMTQMTDDRTCVTSVRAPEGSTSFGPDRMSGLADGAWCPGGQGIGESVVVNQAPPLSVSRMMFINGNAATPEAFRANARVKRARIETSGGHVKTVSLKDSPGMTDIAIPRAKTRWVRLTILETYPGGGSAGPCISAFYFATQDHNR